jgi:hypothetical protein
MGPRVTAARGRRRGLLAALLAFAAAACLVLAIAGGLTARAEQTRPPTTAERAAAAEAAVAARWQAWPVGHIFPARLRYTTSLHTAEHARRAGISPGHGCQAALAGAALAAARLQGCRAALRATYLDELQGVVYTAGVIAFPDPRRAAAFDKAVGRDKLPAGLRAYRLARTGAGLFTEAARQTTMAKQAGPYVLLIVAGYADGRSAAATGQHRVAVFEPAAQLSRDILRPLTRMPTVNCASREWSC